MRMFLGAVNVDVGAVDDDVGSDVGDVEK